MKRISMLILTAATTACVAASIALTAEPAADEASPIFDVAIPAGYFRD